MILPTVNLVIVLAITVLVLAIVCFGLTVTLIHLRRRHRACRRTLVRVRQERDDMRWERRGKRI